MHNASKKVRLRCLEAHGLLHTGMVRSGQFKGPTGHQALFYVQDKTSKVLCIG